MNRRSLESVVAGGAVVAVLAVVGLAGAAILGVRRSPVIVLLAGVAGAAAVGWLAHRRLEATPFRVGAVVVGIAGLGAEVVGDNPGLGAVQIGLLVVAAIVAAIGPRILGPLTRPIPGWLIGVGFVLVAAVLVRIVIGGGGFGHDEAAYALKARSWVSGSPGSGWNLHRGIAQSVLAAVALPFTDSEVALRLVSVALTLATVLALWWLGRVVRSSRVGVFAAAAFVVGPSVMRRGAEFLTDIPSTGLLLIVTALVWRWLSGRTSSDTTLPAAAAVAALAFYFRYQALLSLGLVAVVGTVLYWPRVKASGGSVLKAAGVAVLLLVPHLVWATVETGTPWGVVLHTSGVGGRAYVGEGLVDYLTDFPDLLAGQVGAVAILVALAWFGYRMLGALRRREMSGDDRLAAFLVVPAFGQILALGLVSHGEPRFVFFPVALLMVAAGVAVDDVRRRVTGPLYRAGVAATVAAVVVGLGLAGDRADRNAEARAASTQILVDTARTVVTDAAGACGIVTSYSPQLTWFSGCETALFGTSQPEVGLESDLARYVVFYNNGKRQPTGELRESYEALSDDEPIVLDDPTDSIGDAQIFPLEGE